MKSVMLFTIFLSFFIIFSLPSSSFSEKCHRNDKKALLQIEKDLYNHTNDPKTDCCHWYSVKCDQTTNRIISLAIYYGNISGQIPASIGDLPYLEQLVFHHITNLTGQIPSAIAKLTNLKFLRLSWNNLSGPVPSFLSQLKNLTYLNLSFNNFTGLIPPSLSMLQNLDYLRLDRNKLTGNIPESFGKFSVNNIALYLSHNQLSGTVPRSMGNLDFDALDFSRNKIVGDISFLFGTNKTIFYADFSRNLLKFDLSKVVFPGSLTGLDLNHNQIFGSLPAELAKLELQFLNVSYNRLCGQIPNGGKLQEYQITEYFHNKCLCGAPLPACKL